MADFLLCANSSKIQKNSLLSLHIESTAFSLLSINGSVHGQEVGFMCPGVSL
jgi:hypothetical protein